MARPLVIPLSNDASQEEEAPRIQICGDSVCGRTAAAGAGAQEASRWFTAAVGTPCMLVRQQSGSRTAVLQRKTAPSTRLLPAANGGVVNASSISEHGPGAATVVGEEGSGGMHEASSTSIGAILKNSR